VNIHEYQNNQLEQNKEEKFTLDQMSHSPSLVIRLSKIDSFPGLVK